jgi:RNA polymerase sporulation-specific sigma factor
VSARELHLDRLARRAQDGDEAAFAELARSLTPLLRSEAQRIYVPGADRDDVAQEALVALHRAVLAYDGRRRFSALAITVIRRRLVSMLKAALRAKHQPLDDLRLEQTDEHGHQLGQWIADRAPGPFEQLQQREQLRQVAAAAGRLSELERRVLAGSLDGRSYAQLGPTKRVDNALQRARRHLREACG